MFGRLEYQFLSVQHEPEPASLWNQPLGQHRRILNLNILLGIQQPVYVQQYAKTDLDTAVYSVPAILLVFEYFYLYVPEKQILVFCMMGLLV